MSNKLQYSAQQSSGFPESECGLRFVPDRCGVKAFRLGLMLIMLVSVLVACGEEAEQRRFATDDQPTFVSASPSSGATEPLRPTPTIPAVLSPESLFSTESPDAVFMSRADGVWSIDVRAGSARRIFAAEIGVPWVLATDLTGHRAAILADSAAKDEPAMLLVLAADGTVNQRLDDVEAAFTDVEGPLTPVSLDWSPDGKRLLAGFRGGGLLDVPLRGEPSVVLGPKRLPYLEEAHWSPSGDVVAYVARADPDGPGRLFVAKPRGGATDPVAIAPAKTASDQSVRGMAWAEGGRAILYAQSSSTSETAGQDLFSVAPSGEDRRLVASGGTVAPVGGVERFAVSPDGQAVAYAVYVPGPDTLVFNSLWIESLADETRFRVPVEPGQTLTALRWVSSGLLWDATMDGADGSPVATTPVIYSLGSDLEPHQVGGEATPQAASPEAASPPASPMPRRR